MSLESHPVLEALIVTNDAPTRSLLKKQLAASGCLVHVAHNGREALQALLRTQPQLVIADWTLPDLNGAAFCRALCETRIGRRMYVVLLIVASDQEKLYEAFEAGADDCLEKPVAAPALSARVRAGELRTKLQRETASDVEEMRRFSAELAVTNMRLQQCALSDPATVFPIDVTRCESSRDSGALRFAAGGPFPAWRSKATIFSALRRLAGAMLAKHCSKASPACSGI